MSNYWALTIGIHQYRFLPVLNYAQRDAEQWHQVLLQTGFSPRRCRLLCDAITVATGDTSFPTEPHIRTQFTALQSVVQPEDVVLIFFSGYGLCVQGKDYLLPVEGDPRQILTSGIAVETLFALLKVLPTRRILLLLDANRPQAGFDWGGFGEATSQLAQSSGIATLLSCQPQQFSHEPLTLRQGIFTTALINAIQSGCLTLDQLVASLSQQLPRLSEECWRPRQDLLAVVPPMMRYQLICPDAVPAGRAAGSMAQMADRVGAVLTKQLAFLSQTGSGLAKTMTGWLNPAPSQPSAINGEAGTLAANLAQPFPEAGYTESEPTLSDEFFWRRLLVQGGLIAGILLFGVILRNSNALISGLSLSPSGNEAAFPTRPSVVPQAASPSPTEIFVDPTLSWEAAQTAFQAQQYEEANRQLSRIPSSQRTPEQTQLLEQTNQQLLNQAKTMLIRSREPRSENQVSDLVEAIKIARLVKPQQPLYQEAQQDIDRWSRVILDMAQGRAERPSRDSTRDTAENYQMAISAARLVPTDQTSSHNQAEASIESWSQQILDLAKQSAKEGDLDLAIQIGELIPPYTPVYAMAQEEIAGWRNQPEPSMAESESASAN